MKISTKNTDGNVFRVKQYRQLLWGLLLILLITLPNLLLASDGVISTNVKILFALIISTLVCFYLVKIDKEDLSRTVFLWSITLCITYMSWVNGGLRDSSSLSYPILIVFSALLGGFRNFVAILIYFVAAVIFLGITSLYNWNPHPLNPLAAEQVFDMVLITLLAGYVAWTVSVDMNTALHHLRTENEKVNKSHETIQLMAERDALTGLFNRPACEAHYQAAVEKLSAANERIVLFFLDLDNFKNINDSFGHNAGDELLIAISNGLNKLLRPYDIACRLGGDEFVIIVNRDDVFDIDQFAEQILAVITTPYYIFETTIRMTGSVGIAVTPDDGMVFDDVRKKADIAMYKSKQLGKNTFSYYSAHLHEETLRKTSILDGLKDALENNLLDLHIQPKVNLSTGKMESAEALVRWNRNNPYNFRPDEFIPVLESTEFIHEIGRWCIEEACRICKRWHDDGFTDMSIAVNVSSVQFMRSNFNTVVLNALEESGLPPEFLEIELTEHVLIQHNETIKNQLKSLKDLGIQLSIDDFGTGYSNLSYLINFKVDMIKLDKSFITNINTSTDHLAVVKAVIQMAQILNLKVVAEGVESEAVRKILTDLKCDFAQGFLWSRALPENQFIKAVDRFNYAN